jgi:hypothetical protein
MAVAAGAVARLEDVGAEPPGHIAALLGMAPRPARDRRVLALAHATGRTRLIVDAPIRFTSVVAADLIALSSRIFHRLAPVLGFVQEGSQLVLLLDVEALCARADGHPPPASAPTAGAAREV